MRGALALMLAAALGLLTAAGAQGRKSGHPAPVPSGFVGMMADGPIFNSKVDLGDQFARMHQSGVQTLRVAFDWDQAQPYARWSDVPAAQRTAFTSGPGHVPTDFQTTDAIVRLAARHHLALLPVVVLSPRWDGSPKGRHVQPARDAPYGRYLQALVHRYGPRGSFWASHRSVPRLPITMWQVWNEPDFSYFWDSTAHFARPYVALLRVAHRAIKQADPRAKVVLGSLTTDGWKDLRAIYRVHGARHLFDEVASNTYAPEPSGVVKALRDLRHVMNRNGDRQKSMIDTEVGWPSALGQGTEIFGIETTETGQARRLAALLPLLASNRKRLGLASFYYYTWLSSDQYGSVSPFAFSGLFGFNAASGSVHAKPAFKTFRRLALAMEGRGAPTGGVGRP